MKKVFYLALCFVATVYISSCSSKNGANEGEANAVYNDEAYDIPDDYDEEDYSVDDEEEIDESSFNVDHGFYDLPDGVDIDDDDIEEFASSSS